MKQLNMFQFTSLLGTVAVQFLGIHEMPPL